MVSSTQSHIVFWFAWPLDDLVKEDLEIYDATEIKIWCGCGREKSQIVNLHFAHHARLNLPKNCSRKNLLASRASNSKDSRWRALRRLWQSTLCHDGSVISVSCHSPPPCHNGLPLFCFASNHWPAKMANYLSAKEDWQSTSAIDLRSAKSTTLSPPTSFACFTATQGGDPKLSAGKCKVLKVQIFSGQPHYWQLLHVQS